MKLNKPLIAIAACAIAAALYGLHAGLSSGGGAPASAQTVTYAVTGDAANVTYGPAGSQLSGSSGLDETGAIGNAEYYFVNAQLRGSGSVTCTIKVGGAVVSQATANGNYKVANCEIIRDASGNWIDANRG